MESQSQPFTSPDPGAPPTHPQRNSLADFRTPSAATGQAPPNFPLGPMPVPAVPPPSNANSNFSSPIHRRNGAAPHAGPHGAFAFRDAPGAAKNTSHVPCKFFRLGNCQAGKACPFSHALDTINDPAPCKYFAKGNCKYGYKCANPHMLPDGRDGRKVNHGRRPFAPEAVGFNIGPPAQTSPFPEQGAQNAYSVMPPSTSHFDHYPPSSDDHFQPQRTLDTLPTIDQAYNSHSGIQYGSPPTENRNPMSPPIRALDAQLPSSFDSNGISNVARYGPIASSVPSRFGFGPSSPTTSTATSTAFGNLGYMARGNANGNNGFRAADLASSPPMPQEPVFAKRTLHSDRISQPQNIASSLPVPRPMMRMHRNTVDSEDDSDDDKVNWLPGALSDDVMTPQEKMRRFSRHEDDSGQSARGSLTMSGLGSAQESKVGSPSNGGSPTSRWGALFTTQKQRQQDSSNDFPSSSPYGHVGSPLRNSSLPVNPNASPTIKPIGRPQTGTLSGDVSPFGWSSPPTSGRLTMGSGIGILSQQLKNTRLRDGTSLASSTDPPSSSLHPPGTRSISQSTSANAIAAATASSAAGASSLSRLDRAVSNSSIGRRSDRIDEEPEQEPCLFEMDEEDTRVKELKKERERQKRWSGLSGGGSVYQGGSPWNSAATVSEPRVSISSSDGMSSSSPPANGLSSEAAAGAATAAAGGGLQKPVGDQRPAQP